MKYICIVEPLNDTKNNRYLFTYEFGRPPVKDMIVHCETRLKNGMYGKITEWARVPKTDEKQLLNIIHNLYKYGSTGKVYPTKEQAEKQGRAIKASQNKKKRGKK